MKELKFRAWTHLNKKYKMVYSKNLKKHDILDFSFKTDGKNIIDVMQYIGIKDCNNKEIYEGDIIERVYNTKTKDKEVGVVEYRNGQYIIKISDNICYDISVDAMFSPIVSNYEIIGNKYQNSILLLKL